MCIKTFNSLSTSLSSFLVDENNSSFLARQLTYIIRSKFFFNMSDDNRLDIKRFYEYLEQDPLFSVLNGDGSNKKHLMSIAKQLLIKHVKLNNQGNVIIGVIIKDDLPFRLHKPLINDIAFLNKKSYLISSNLNKVSSLTNERYILEFLDRHYFQANTSFVIRAELITLVKNEISLKFSPFDEILLKKDRKLIDDIDNVLNHCLPFCEKQKSKLKETRDIIIYKNLIKKDDWLTSLNKPLFF